MIKQYPIIVDCVWETFEDTVTWMIVDNVGILSHRRHKKPQSLTEDHCERVETLHLQPIDPIDCNHW